jgi:hypothetical protein
MDRIFFSQPTRRWLVWLACRHWLPPRPKWWITDRLYPDDVGVTFPALVPDGQIGLDGNAAHDAPGGQHGAEGAAHD